KAWDGNWTHDAFLAWTWEGRDGRRLLVVVNYAGHQSQCYALLPFADLAGHSVQLKDLMSSASYERRGDDLCARGLYLDMPAWGQPGYARPGGGRPGQAGGSSPGGKGGAPPVGEVGVAGREHGGRAWSFRGPSRRLLMPMLLLAALVCGETASAD